jgi:hypothetical protein
MRLPVKLNKAGWPSVCGRLSFAFDDPRPIASGECSKFAGIEYSRAISSLQFGVTFKTTRPGRHQHSNQYVIDCYRVARPVILDVGASDGSTSLDLIRLLGLDFQHYFVTDLNHSTRCGFDGRGAAYFLNREGRCVLRASKRFLAYSDTDRAIFPLNFISAKLLSGAENVAKWREVLLMQPELVRLASSDPRISIMQYDMFVPWKGQPPDLIKIANLLNSKYFSDSQMRQAIEVQCANLGIGGRLLLVSEDEDSGIERFSAFRKTGSGMVLEQTHDRGAKAAHLVPLADSGTPAGGASPQEARL